MARSPRVPKYRRHSSGQARVTLNGKDYLLGLYNSAQSQEAYRRLIAEWLARPHGQSSEARGQGESLSINKLILAYWKFPSAHYGSDHCVRPASYRLRDPLLVGMHRYGPTRPCVFGPLARK